MAYIGMYLHYSELFILVRSTNYKVVEPLLIWLLELRDYMYYIYGIVSFLKLRQVVSTHFKWKVFSPIFGNKTSFLVRGKINNDFFLIFHFQSDL